ncbi:MAG: hypothetical protein HLUCCX10_14485 [Algoriphagus marincola HL-49]|uniref:Uncharacterized protein n=1 Tax=Algoriphagus marincola HL-49 TaxID=1305737 RepID=A0A0P7YES3_9BACT|nr:MAG: hypothetical protein HLUCCX10_14485 [Algoriphagus marincola HL-49]
MDEKNEVLGFFLVVTKWDHFAVNQLTPAKNKWRLIKVGFVFRFIPKKMKTKILILSVLVFGILSCVGSEDNPQDTNQAYFRFKINGTLKEFEVRNSPMTFSFNSDGSVYLAGFMILDDPTDGTKNFISGFVRNETLFQVNETLEMQDPILFQNIPMVRIQLTYSDEAGELYNAVLFQKELPGLLITDDATFRFTEISQNWVKGEFTANLLGPVFVSSGRGDTELRITEGEFSMPLFRSNLP